MVPAWRAGAPVVIQETLPARVNSTPFRVKGHVYQKMIVNIEESTGLAPVLERGADPEVTEFFSQHFLAGTWYDALPMGPVSYQHARVLGIPMHMHTRERGRIVAQQDVPGVYRALLTLFSAELLVGQLTKAAAFYFSFGKATAERPGPGRARSILKGLPYTLAPMMAGVVEGFVSVALEMSGAKDVQVRTIDSTYDGGLVAGIPTAAVRHDIAWRVKS